MFYLRLNKIVITDNGSIKPLVGLFGHDFSNIRLLSFVTTGDTVLPDMTRLLRETDPGAQAAIVKEAIQAVVSSRKLTEVARVTDHAQLTFGPSGYVVYQSDIVPPDINWQLLVLKSNRDLRDTGQSIQTVLNDPGLASFTDNLLTLVNGVAGVANPAFAAGVAITEFAAKTLSANLMRAGDKELGLLYLSLNRVEHYMFVERKQDDVRDLTGNMTVDYSIFGFERAIPVRPATT